MTAPRPPARLALLLLLGLIAAAPATAPATRPARSPNAVVLRIARSFPDGGGYDTRWAGTGTPEEIRFAGRRVLAKGIGGTYCCGFTLTVAMRAADQLGLLRGKSFEQVRRFQKEWYGAVADPATRERQSGIALKNLGIGHPVGADDARPGDFCQFWRTKSGHSVIFLGWVEQRGRRVGLRYRSSQGSTHGIADHTEFFEDTGLPKAQVDRNRLYFARFDE
jgi:hypothetical protein